MAYHPPRYELLGGLLQRIAGQLKEWSIPIEQVFQDCDSNGDDKIQIGEFSQFLRRFQSDLSREEVEALFASFDIDSSGYIDLREFASALQQAGWQTSQRANRRHSSGDERMAALRFEVMTGALVRVAQSLERSGMTHDQFFNQLDRDSQGVLYQRDLERVLLGVESSLSQAELLELFQQFDTDGSKTIDRAEFSTALREALRNAGGVKEPILRRKSAMLTRRKSSGGSSFCGVPAEETLALQQYMASVVRQRVSEQVPDSARGFHGVLPEGRPSPNLPVFDAPVTPAHIRQRVSEAEEQRDSLRHSQASAGSGGFSVSSEATDLEGLAAQVYAHHGLNLDSARNHAMRLLDELGLRPEDAGSLLKTAGDQYSRRQLKQNCFYLSLARSYGGQGDLEQMHRTATLLKSIIEKSVTQKHPDYRATGRIGEEVPAEADFLLYPLGDGKSQLSEFAAVVICSIVGQISIWKGVRYDDATRGEPQRQATNLLLLWHTHDHYQSLVAKDGSKPALTLDKLKRFLDDNNVFYEECDGIS